VGGGKSAWKIKTLVFVLRNLIFLMQKRSGENEGGEQVWVGGSVEDRGEEFFHSQHTINV